MTCAPAGVDDEDVAEHVLYRLEPEVQAQAHRDAEQRADGLSTTPRLQRVQHLAGSPSELAADLAAFGDRHRQGVVDEEEPREGREAGENRLQAGHHARVDFDCSASVTDARPRRAFRCGRLSLSAPAERDVEGHLASARLKSGRRRMSRTTTYPASGAAWPVAPYAPQRGSSSGRLAGARSSVAVPGEPKSCGRR